MESEGLFVLETLVIGMLFCFCLGTALVIGGVHNIKLNKRFQVEAIESQAFVERLDEVVTSSSDSSSTDYYVNLRLSDNDLPSTLRLRIGVRDFYALEEGSMATIYHLPCDSRHVVFAKNHYKSNSVSCVVIGVVFLLMALVCGVVLLSEGVPII